MTIATLLHAARELVQPRNQLASARERSRRLAIESLEERLALTTMPSDFTETLITTGANLSSPTAMEIAPGNQIWVLEQGGAVKVIGADGTAHTALTISVDSSGERGLLGIAFDPGYDGAGPNEDYVYLYYTTPRAGTNDPANNRVTRWHVNGAGTATPTLDSQVILRELPPENEDNNLATDGDTNHNGGAMHFGTDGKLYVAVGDHNYDTTPQSNHVSQLITTPFGKILRLNADGSNPSDNPFYTGSGSDWQGSIYAMGLRNPYTFDISASGTMLINDVGENVWEEINLGERGANYGWAGSSSPLWEGFEDPDPTWGNYRDPLMAYSHAALGGCAITGGVFYPQNSQFGAQYGGKYFFADYCGGWIRVFDPNSPGSQSTPDTSIAFASSLTTGFPVDLRVDSVGNLYYLARGGPGEIYRISFRAPAISQQPVNQTVSEGQAVSFTVAANGGGTLAYQWQKLSGSTWGNIAGATAATYTIPSANQSHAGQYRAVVTNSAGSATSNAATLTVNVAGQSPTITGQPASLSRNVGQSASFTVAATGTSPLAYQWQKLSGSTWTNIAGATSATYSIASVAVSHAGQYRAVVTNSLGSATSSAATLDVNQLPSATISVSSNTYTFGQTISFSAAATDPEDGPLPGSSYTWSVDIGHNVHFHPHVAPFSGASGSFVANFEERDPNQFYRIRLTVTDSDGAATSTFYDVTPVLVQVTLASNPAGIPLTVDGTAAATFASVVGMPRTIQAPASYTLNGTTYNFANWSDGQPATHNIATPAANTTYTANYVPASTGQGLRAEFFDFTSGLSVLPDLSARTPEVARVDAQVNYASTDAAWSGLDSRFADTFAARHSGQLRVDAAGAYTFYLNSDDGARLWIDGELVINNDGLHGMQELSATRTLAAGQHSVRLEYFENFGGAGLILSWAGPGFAKQVVPTGVLTPDGGQGLRAEFFDYTTELSVLPDLSARTPDVSRVDAQVNYPSTGSAWAGLDSRFAETFATRHSGLLRINTTGAYTFYLNSDDGARLWIDGELVINNDGLHGMQELSATRTLVAGQHSIRVEFFENFGGAGLILSWAGPGFAKQVVPAAVLTPESQGLRAEFFDYTAALSTLPDLSTRTPDAVRVDTQLNYADVSTAWAGLDSRFADTFAARHTGFLRTDAAGDYTFYLNSDDGSRLWIDNVLVIDNNGLHSIRELSATRTLTAGYHSIRVEYFENGGTAGLSLSWAGPGIAKQVIPANRLALQAPGSGAAAARTAAAVDAPSAAGGNLSTLRAGAARLASDLAAQAGFSGLLKVPQSGDYTFYVPGDARAELSIAGATISPKAAASGELSATVALSAGYHRVDLTGDDAGALARQKLAWSGPKIAKQLVPAWLLFEMLG